MHDSVKPFHSILIQSIVWDLIRYHDSQGKFYLQNLLNKKK
jgi:hypothetical protein